MEEKKIATTELELNAVIGAAAIELVKKFEGEGSEDKHYIRFASKLAIVVCQHFTGEKKLPESTIKALRTGLEFSNAILATIGQEEP